MLLRVLCLFAAACAVFAQSGTIQGVVTDSTDAVVAGAKVAVVNIDTGLRRELTTNDQGFYTAPTLPVCSFISQKASLWRSDRTPFREPVRAMRFTEGWRRGQPSP